MPAAYRRSDRVLSHPVGCCRRAADAFSSVSPLFCGVLNEMELLLVSQQQIPSSEAAGALWALKGLLFGMGPLMALQVFQSCKSPATVLADMRARLVCLWGRELCRVLARLRGRKLDWDVCQRVLASRDGGTHQTPRSRLPTHLHAKMER